MSCSNLVYAQVISKVIHLSTRHSHCYHLISHARFVTLWEHEIWESELPTTPVRRGMPCVCRGCLACAGAALRVPGLPCICRVSNVCAKMCYNHFAAIRIAL